jgi:hypothetical protein
VLWEILTGRYPTDPAFEFSITNHSQNTDDSCNNPFSTPEA